MAPIRVDLGDRDSGEIYKNHRPEFRPVDSDKLYGAERTLATIVGKIAEAIPTDLVVDYIYDRVTIEILTARIAALVDDDPDVLQRPIFSAFQSGTEDAAEQQRRDVNERLAKLRSPVRLRSAAELRKNTDPVVVWGPTLESFDRADPNAAGRVYARFRSESILADLTTTVRTSIETAVADSFTVSQSFTTGRTVTGLTSQQTSQTIYAILNEISPTRPTGADLAARYVGHTRGLTNRYTTAVINHGNAVAFEQIAAGQSPRNAMRLADRAMERYADKLRRSRARAIARTEIAYAQNAGIQYQNQLLLDSGVVAPDSQKEWVTGPFDVCDICVPLGGTRVPLSLDFSWQGGSGNPPAHPNCRCKTRVVPTIDKAPVRGGAGTIEDPFRYEFADGWIAPINPTTSRAPRPRTRPASLPRRSSGPTVTRSQAETILSRSAWDRPMFHGTTSRNAQAIRDDGFKLAELGSNTGNGGLMGAGHYFADEGYAYISQGERLEVVLDVAKVADATDAAVTRANLYSAYIETLEEFGEDGVERFLAATKPAGASLDGVAISQGGTFAEQIGPIDDELVERLRKIWREANPQYRTNLMQREVMLDQGFDAQVLRLDNGQVPEMVVFRDEAIKVVVDE